MTDWDEVGVEHWVDKGLITYDKNGNIILPTVKQCMHFAEYSYVKEGLERFHDEYGKNFARAIEDTRILPIKSDPTREDSDGDGIDDLIDPRKLNSSDIKTNCLCNGYSDNYDENDIFNHNYEFIKQDGNYRVLKCINCEKTLNVPYYICGHIYGANRFEKNEASVIMQEFKIISSDILNDFGYIKYDGELYPITYLDYSESDFISPIYYKVASYTKSEIKFDLFEGIAGTSSEDIITIEDTYIYTGKEGGRNFQYRIQPSNIESVASLNSIFLIKYLLQVVQDSSTLFQINYIVGKSSAGHRTAAIRVDISKLLSESSEYGGQPKTVAQMLLGIDNSGELYNVYSKIVDITLE